MEALEFDDPREREAYILRACGGDERLRARVKALLRRHQSDDLLALDRLPAVESAVTADRPTAAEHPGTVIGPYKLLQEIGEGGMGVVYMAEQTRPVKRLVALKVIKAGLDSRQVIARFEAERQALALMDHPNIAKVLDAGTTGSGQPFFVMELVKGVPITDYCDERRLTPRERLELFIPVCQAVQHAHQKGIIHRDLKPSNVVVALYDDVPVPKVIDFGVAKATGPKLTERTLFTEFGTVVGTPEYMSPEQAELNQLDIDTRSDIYSLGVLLYELLTGTTPLDRKRLRESSLLEVLRLIREEEAPRPSTRLSETEELPAIAARRGLEPGKLSRLVRGELDWIVLKALEKNRNRRYVTANSLAMDIRRYLVDEPVLACPPSPLYRFGKFARQNRAALVIAAVIGVGLLVTAGTLAVSNRLVTAERDEKIKALGDARTEADKANAINSLLQEMLASANPDSTKGADYTVRQLLDEFSSRLGNQLREQPEVEAAVRVTVGNAYRRLGAIDRAQQELLAALELRRRVFGTEHPKVAEILVDYAWALQEKREFDEAVARTRAALDIYRRQRGPKGAMIRALWSLQQFLISQNRYDEAEDVAREGLALARAHPREECPEVASILHCYAQAKLKQGRHAEAEALAREAVVLHRRLHGPDHPETGWGLAALGRALRGLDRQAEAEVTLRQALAVFRRYYGSEHKSVAGVLGELTSLLKARGDQAGLEALSLEDLSLANRRVQQQPEEPVAWLERAKAHAELGHWNEARADYARAAAVGANADPALGGRIVRVEIDQGRAMREANRLPEA
jgi:serine/threonine protein kinase